MDYYENGHSCMKKIDSEKAAPLNLYDYTNYRDYLRDYLRAKQEQNKKFSLRVFARILGFASGSTPKMLLDGQRSLTLESARKIAKGLKFNAQQAKYFETLVEFENANNAEQKNGAAQKILAFINRYKTGHISRDRKEYLSHPEYVVIREMLHLPKFKEDPNWIGSSLSPKISHTKVSEALDLLTKLGLIKRTKKGELALVESVVETDAEVSDFDVYTIHQKLLDLAKEALASVDGSERHNAALTLPISLKKMPEIKKLITDFQKNLLECIDDGKEDYDDVFHLTVALFPATRTKEDKS